MRMCRKVDEWMDSAQQANAAGRRFCISLRALSYQEGKNGNAIGRRIMLTIVAMTIIGRPDTT